MTTGILLSLHADYFILWRVKSLCVNTMASEIALFTRQEICQDVGGCSSRGSCYFSSITPGVGKKIKNEKNLDQKLNCETREIWHIKLFDFIGRKLKLDKIKKLA